MGVAWAVEGYFYKVTLETELGFFQTQTNSLLPKYLKNGHQFYLSIFCLCKGIYDFLVLNICSANSHREMQ